MAEEFAQLEITLNEAAKNGNVDYIIALLKDVGKLHHLWQVLSRFPGRLCLASARRTHNQCKAWLEARGVAAPPSRARLVPQPRKLSNGFGKRRDLSTTFLTFSPSRVCVSCQPNAAQAVAIEKAAAACLRKGGEDQKPEGDAAGEETPAPATASSVRLSLRGPNSPSICRASCNPLPCLLRPSAPSRMLVISLVLPSIPPLQPSEHHSMRACPLAGCMKQSLHRGCEARSETLPAAAAPPPAALVQKNAAHKCSVRRRAAAAQALFAPPQRIIIINIIIISWGKRTLTAA